MLPYTRRTNNAKDNNKTQHETYICNYLHFRFILFGYLSILIQQANQKILFIFSILCQVIASELLQSSLSLSPSSVLHYILHMQNSLFQEFTVKWILQNHSFLIGVENPEFGVLLQHRICFGIQSFHSYFNLNRNRQ